MRALSFALAVVALAATVAHADPVISTHPRLLLSAAEKTRLLAKKNANDPSWQALKARADALATLPISQYKSASRNTSPPGTIYYSYQGEGWYDAALPLAIAYQMTGDVKYSNQLIVLVQEMIRAQSDPDNQPPLALLPIRPDNYYPARNLMSVLALIYDHCYDQLSASLKSQMVTLMNDYYDDTSVDGYQAQNYSWASDGNFFGGHLYGVALMGYASFGDNPRAQEMIEWARIRFDGTPAPAVPPSKIPFAWRTQCFEGGQRPAVALDYLGPDITGNPFKGGFDFQAWSYGSEEYSRMIDYMLIVKSATGEDIITPRINWFSQILRAEKHALFPNRFMIDPTGDWGGFQGAVIPRVLPTRMAFILAGTADGPAAQSFAYSEIGASNIPDVEVFALPEWVDFYFGNPSRPSTELLLPPYYTGFGPNYPQAAHSPGGTNGAIPYFIMRSDWGANATWASIKMGPQWWDDHQHYDAGHMFIARGSDHLLVSATDWKTELDGGGNPIYGRSGILGPSLQVLQASLKNTLYFDDFGDFQRTDNFGSGGQSAFGIDEVVADELNQDFSYVRSDLSTAYNRAGDPDDNTGRKLDFFYRNFLYLRAPNVFVVYDQVKALTSNNPRGPYKKHMRWHFPEIPAITGKMARVDHGQSRLFIDTVLPANATLNVVNEWTNPDPCDGSVLGCVPFGDNAGTFRVEVSDPLNPLSTAFLTVLLPGANTSTGPTDTQVASLDNKMIGVVIQQPGGARSIVLFNNQSGQVPAPITSTSYLFPGSGLVTHVLTGLVPNAAYAVALNNGIVSVNQNATGNRTASPSGVLHFLLSTFTTQGLSIDDPSIPEGNSGATNAVFTVSLSAPSNQPVTVNYATANGSALAGSDYVAMSGVLTIPAGSTTGMIAVAVTGDTILENNETFSMSLSSPTNATLLKAMGTGTIVNDDSGKTACASGCDFTRIQDAINASPPGGNVLVRSTYDSITAGEVFPIQTLVINQAGSITIAGETDAAGNPTTTVRTRSGAVDAFSIVSPGSALMNLRIVPGDATRVNRVIAAARNPGSCPGATCHLNGLTIRNVVIDFTVIGGTATPHFNTGNAIDLLADNVLIDKVTIKGIAGNSIFVDGDSYTIQNSTLDGRDGGTIRSLLAIGFGADAKLAGVVCSGFPSNYVIDSNTIVGYANGIQWCSGRNNTVSNNAITDISGKGIDTSGSQGTRIFGNVLQQNTTGATHGIGLSNNAFQTCTGNTVRNNKVLGRAPARDMQRGIVVQNCVDTTIFQNEVRDFADNGGAIYVTMAAGVATKTTIQGNTVIGGNAAGIVYFGADSGATAVDQSVIRDNVVNEFKRNGITVQGIKGVRSGAGAGNVVAYNTVRAVNLGIFGDTHAFNLQYLANTAFDRNTALDTKGSGVGFFLANSTGVNGNCNTGSTNGGGLFAQVNVSPVYGNANVNCRVALYSHYDFDGDGKSDVTMYRHTTGEWFTRNSSNGADTVLAFGNPGSDDIPAPGNYTVAGRTDRAIYRYTTGEWYIRRATDGGTTVVPFGSPLVGDVPMPADYDGDGITDLAVFRTSTANAEWYIRRSSDGATQYVAWGCAACADLGVPGDYDGDTKADVAVYRRSTGEWFIRKSTDTVLQQVPFGDVAQGDLPVPGRYTQASKTDMAVYRSLTGDWLIRRSTDFGTTTVNFGSPSAGDFPVSADFTQSGITDIAVYRPTPPTAMFRVRKSTDFSTLIVPYGNPGSQDAPLTAR